MEDDAEEGRASLKAAASLTLRVVKLEMGQEPVHACAVRHGAMGCEEQQEQSFGLEPQPEPQPKPEPPAHRHDSKAREEEE